MSKGYIGEQQVDFLINGCRNYVHLDLGPVEYGLLIDAVGDESEFVIVETLVNSRLLKLGYTYCSELRSWTREGDGE